MQRKWLTSVVAALALLAVLALVASRGGGGDADPGTASEADAGGDARGNARGNAGGAAADAATTSTSAPRTEAPDPSAAAVDDTTPETDVALSTTVPQPQPGDPVPPVSDDDGRIMFVAFAEATWQRDIFDEETDADWYGGYEFTDANVDVQVYAGSAEEASSYCALLGPAWAWFHKGNGALTITGLGVTPDGSVSTADFVPVACPAATAYEDPAVATAPPDPAAITRRATEFLDEYYAGFLADSPWFVSVEAETEEVQRIIVTVLDDPATHCPGLRAITDWFMHAADGTPVPYELIVNDAPC